MLAIGQSPSRNGCNEASNGYELNSLETDMDSTCRRVKSNKNQLLCETSLCVKEAKHEYAVESGDVGSLSELDLSMGILSARSLV
jgi:hypothetical protein